jgi:hypothetical protein
MVGFELVISCSSSDTQQQVASRLYTQPLWMMINTNVVVLGWPMGSRCLAAGRSALAGRPRTASGTGRKRGFIPGL